MRNDTMTRWAMRGACVGALAAVAGLAGCRGERSEDPPHQFLPDMDDSPKFKPQAQTEFFADGRSMRPTVVGTVAFGWSTHPDDPARRRFLKEDEAYYQGALGVDDKGEPNYIDRIPVPVTGALLKRGQQRFNAICSACHGYLGDGKGEVGKRWSAVLPNYHDPKYRDRTQKTGKDGYVFNVIRHGVFDVTGKQKMPSYGHAVNEDDAWAVVAYVRALQASWTNDLAEVPADVRPRLESTRPPPPKPKPATPAPAAPGAAPGAGAPATPGAPADTKPGAKSPEAKP